MGHPLDARPLAVRLQKRIEKYQKAGFSGPLATDVQLHRQSVEEITRLTVENERLRKHIERAQLIRDVPFLKNYHPFRDLGNEQPAGE